VGALLDEPSPDRGIIKWTWEIDSQSRHGDPRAQVPLMIVTLTGSYVPEPATLVLLLTGGLACLGSSRRVGDSVRILQS
jgi:hypothetical protein